MRYRSPKPLAFLMTALLSAQVVLTNETILKLVQAKIGEDAIISMVNQQQGAYSLAPGDVAALKTAGVSDKVIAAMIVRNGATNAQPSSSTIYPSPLILHDATPIRLRLNRNLSSEDAKAGDSVDFEVLDDLKVDDVLLIARGGTAIATITEAEHKKRMARGGKLDVNIDYVRLVNGDKVALRAVKEAKGGGHTGAMTGGMVATAIVFFPAAPFFLFMHGKDVTIPKGTEITAYVDGEIKLDRGKFAAPAQTGWSAPVPQGSASLIDFTFASTPPNAVVSMYGQPLGRTPFTTRLQPGTYKATFSANGYLDSMQEITVAAGYPAMVNAKLQTNK